MVDWGQILIIGIVLIALVFFILPQLGNLAGGGAGGISGGTPTSGNETPGASILPTGEITSPYYVPEKTAGVGSFTGEGMNLKPPASPESTSLQVASGMSIQTAKLGYSGKPVYETSQYPGGATITKINPSTVETKATGYSGKPSYIYERIPSVGAGSGKETSQNLASQSSIAAQKSASQQSIQSGTVWVGSQRFSIKGGKVQ